MIEIQQESEKKTRCLLVGEPNNNLYELESLISTLGMECAGKITLLRIVQNPVYGIGSGKAHEICEAAKELQADCIIFDFTIEPTKQRNWEKLAKIPVFDRQEVILRIFAQRAQTKEAVIQVELARLEYSRPRLAHMYGDLARQRGGNYGAKGSGETQLELDQRQVRQKIQQLRQELKKVMQNREVQRKRREKNRIPLCSLVGYTNAGKSSLLNKLTGADVLVENKLFATLDPTTRKLFIPDFGEILLSDTVGFINNLPHSLIDAFKSTLEEAQKADLLLLVVDASDENSTIQYETCRSVLKEIGAEEKPFLVVLNKIDIVSKNEIALSTLAKNFPDSVRISVKEELNLDKLLSVIKEHLERIKG